MGKLPGHQIDLKVTGKLYSTGLLFFFNINLFLFIPEECFDDYTIFVEHIPILSQLKPHILFLYRNRCEDAPNFQSAEYTSERYTVLCKAQPDHFYYG